MKSIREYINLIENAQTSEPVEIHELLNNPAKVKGYAKNTQDDWSARFHSTNGSNYVVHILGGAGYPQQWRKWVEQGLGKPVDPSELVYVTFEEGGTATKAGSVGVTGAGSSVEVAASVAQALKEYINAYHPTYISYMITDSDSRIGVYDRGLKRLGYRPVKGRFGNLYLYSNEQEVSEDEASAKMGLMSAMGSNNDHLMDQRREMAQRSVEQLANKK